MAWKLVEVSDDDGDVLTDQELLVLRLILKSVAKEIVPSKWLREHVAAISDKLVPYLGRAIDNEHRRNREESVP
jgi:hypothetical protein